MPAAPRTVTGNVATLTGSARAGVAITFTKQNVTDISGQYGKAVINEPVVANTNELGVFSITLYPGSYTVTAAGSNGPKRATMELTELGSTDFADLIGQASMPITSTEVADARAARDAAEGYRDAAAASATAAAEAKTNAETAETNAEGAAEAAEAARDAAVIAKDAAELAADRVDLGALDAAVAATEADALATAADRVQTGLDRTATAADVIAADADRVAAEAARDAANAGANVYASTAAGLAAVSEGGQFMVVVGDEIVRYEDVGGVATERARYPSAEFVTSNLTMQIAGPVAVTATGTVVNSSNTFYYPSQAREYDQRLLDFDVGADANGVSLELFVVELGAGTVTLLEGPFHYQVGPGVSTQDGRDILVPAGHILGVRCTVSSGVGLVFTSGTIPNGEVQLNHTGRPGVATAITSSTSNGIQVKFRLAAAVKAAAPRSEAMALTIGGMRVSGATDPLVITGALTGTYTYIDANRSEGNRALTRLRIAVGSAHTLRVAAVTMTGVNPTIQREIAVSLAAGLNDVEIDLNLLEDEYPAFSGTSFRFQNSTNPIGMTGWVAGASLSNGMTTSLSRQHRFELQYETRSGLDLATTRNSRGSSTGVGLNLLAAADATGVADATGIVASARAAHPNPYVRPGTFAVTSVPQSGNGLWGPGRLVMGGRGFILPRQPRVGSLYEGVRQRLATCIGTGAPLIAIGDSITHWSAASVAANHWLDQLCGFANILHSPGDLPIMTSFGNIDVYTPAFYGVTFTGSTSGGTRGPIGNSTAGSVILAAGAALTFTGTFETIGCTYTQEPGAGTLTIARGATTLATIDAAGTLTLDRTSGLIATGVTSSATYTITASGGSVEITSLLRLGVRAVTDIKRLHVMRAARGSFTFPDFTSAKVTSMLAIAGHLSASPPSVLIKLGINDAASVTTAAAMKTRADTLIAALKSGGVSDIIGVLPMRPSGGSWATRTANYDAVIAGLTQSYRAEGVQIIRPDFDLTGGGLASDGLHPNNAGNDVLATVIAEALAA